MARHLYEALGVSHDASPEDIRKAYRKKALQTHPDRLPPTASEQEKAKAGEKFRKVNNAYEVLNDEEKRRAYDRYGEWPPPEPQHEPEIRHHRHHGYGPRRHDTYHGPFDDPFFRDFSGPFRSQSRGHHPLYGFTDPFELFNSIFGDMQAMHNSFFNHSPFDDHFPARGFGQFPFNGGLLSDRMFGDLPSAMAFPLLDDHNGQGATFQSASRGVFTRGPDGNGQWVAQSTTTRTVNGVTETVHKRRDANGNEHVTYKYPDGRERYLINGVEQSNSVRDEQFLPPPPPYEGSSSQPPPPLIKEPRHESQTRRHSRDRRASEPHRYAPPPNPPPDGPVIPPTNHYNPNHHNSANEYYQTPQRQYGQPGPYEPANMKRSRDYERISPREHRRRYRGGLDEPEEPHQRRKWWNRW